MRTHPLLATLGSLALACSLAACSDDPEPIIEATPAAGPTSDPPASPTPTATPTPDEPESAKAFIRQFERASTAMKASGATASYLAMTDECSSCQALAQQVTRIYEAGGSVVDGGSTVSSIVRHGGGRGEAVVDYTVTARPSKVLDSKGNIETKFPGGTSTYQVNLERRGATWVVGRISRLAS
jgi:hypothetical protein